MSDPPLMQNHTLKVADIYVPAARRKTLEPDKVEKIAESMIEEGQITPIQVRKDGERYVLSDLVLRVQSLLHI